MSTPALTSTSYAILGLLAVRPWTTHELVQQVDRSLRRIWPRTRSKLYEEPKKLVAHGYARAADDSVGRRRRTRYTITPAGRRALAAWVQEPGAGPLLECEALVKIHFADSASKAAVLANLEEIRDWVRRENVENVETARAYLEDRGTFPERAALNQVVGRFLTDYYACVARWADWAIEHVQGWPDDITQAPYDLAVAKEVLRLTESIPPPDSPGQSS